MSWQSVYLNGASANYRISNLANGDYTLLVQDEAKGTITNPDSNVAGTNLKIRSSSLAGLPRPSRFEVEK